MSSRALVTTLAASLFCGTAAAQTLRDADTVFSSGNWKVVRSVDTMKDITKCTGIYRDDYGVQLTPNTLYIRIEGGLESVTLRIGEKPAQRLRLATDMEKRIRSISISGTDFADLEGSDRIRYQVTTLVRGLKTEEILLQGFTAALENIRAGCPLPAAAEVVSVPATASLAGSLCSAVLVSRMRSQGLKSEQITAICQ